MNQMQMFNHMFGGNPLFQRAQQMAKGKSANQVQEVCKNICKQRGFDFDQMKNQFQQQYDMMRQGMCK